ncbi:fimbrial protein [Serratia marcescens]|uniref:fimbrial protein n=1 Tax=Serratia marcescens TaxID=615 RepID=UPI0011C1AE82|nr:fimbrial protein [Serratia marcescens]
MFKKKSPFLILLSVFSFGVLAETPTATLIVSGSIAPPTCTVNGQESEDEIEYVFNVSPGVFPASGNLTLDPIVKNITVACDSSTFMAFNVTDNRTGTELTTGSTYFGLGSWGADNKKVGSYRVLMSNAKYISEPGANPVAAGVRYGGNVAASTYLDKTLKTAWTKSSGTATLAPGQIFTADLAVYPVINGDLKNGTGDEELDGNAVLAFSFGL